MNNTVLCIILKSSICTLGLPANFVKILEMAAIDKRKFIAHALFWRRIFTTDIALKCVDL